MPWNNRYRRIVLTGPEAAGKTTLARALAEKSGGTWIPEYAREYVERLNRKYDRNDVEHIARVQVNRYDEAVSAGTYPVVFDTFLVVTKVWLTAVFGSAPPWLDRAIRRCAIDMYLLCCPDLPWLPDPVRENPGERRVGLFRAYRAEIERAGLPFAVVEGSGEERLARCLTILEGDS